VVASQAFLGQLAKRDVSQLAWLVKTNSSGCSIVWPLSFLASTGLDPESFL
jgi:hypothetical protein